MADVLQEAAANNLSHAEVLASLLRLKSKAVPSPPNDAEYAPPPFRS